MLRCGWWTRSCKIEDSRRFKYTMLRCAAFLVVFHWRESCDILSISCKVRKAYRAMCSSLFVANSMGSCLHARGGGRGGGSGGGGGGCDGGGGSGGEGEDGGCHGGAWGTVEVHPACIEIGHNHKRQS